MALDQEVLDGRWKEPRFRAASARSEARLCSKEENPFIEETLFATTGERCAAIKAHAFPRVTSVGSISTAWPAAADNYNRRRSR